MRKHTWLFAAIFVAALFVPTTAGAAGTPIPGQYIVVLKGGVDVSSTVAQHRRNAHADVLMTYGRAIKGYAARLSASGLATVKADPNVAFVQQDVGGNAITGKPAPPPPPPPPSQTLPPGIDRIDAELTSPTVLTNATGTHDTAGDVAVFDTGIQTNHPDLNVAGGVNCLGSYTGHDGTIGDENGHGTHTAGIIGAKDNGSGVVGVAPGVRLWSVRDLNNMGSGSTSTQLCGINWITANAASLGIKVVNASQALFGYPDDGNCGYTKNDVLHQAICASTQAGILWVFAAGNNGGTWANAAGPSYREVLAVTAMADNNGTPNVPSTKTFTCTATGAKSAYASETDDKYASFSTYGVTTLDQSRTVAAPGVCIYSTWKGSTYATESGTSMAAPHATAVAHRCILSGQCAGTPAETIAKLRGDAQAWTDANPSWGFTGDPKHPVTGRYYGYLVRAAQY